MIEKFNAYYFTNWKGKYYGQPYFLKDFCVIECNQIGFIKGAKLLKIQMRSFWLSDINSYYLYQSLLIINKCDLKLKKIE